MKNVIRGLMSAGVLIAASALATPAEAATITLSGVCSQQTGSNDLGDCTKTATYDDETNLLTITLTNTSDPANGGFITADAFNLPTLDSEIFVTNFATTMETTDTNFGFAQAGSFSVSPNGDRGMLISTDGSFTGGGSGAGGIGVGQSATFTLTLASDLTDAQFNMFFGSEQIRFQSFGNGGSDKTTVTPGDDVVPSPEPASLLLLGTALGVAMRSARKRRNQQA